MNPTDLSSPELYLNRELSQLEFNFRVLQQALDVTVPLLERLKYLCITSTNLDEFFETRVARLKQQLDSGVALVGIDARGLSESLHHVGVRAHQLIDQQYVALNDIILPALANAHIRFLRRSEWDASQERWIRNHFEDHLLPVLSPFTLDPAHPFPRILNKNLNFIVTLTGRDAFGRKGGMAVVQTPRALPRIIPLPGECTTGPHDFVFLSSVIHTHVNHLFPGMEVTGCYQFRVTRNSELFVDEEEIDDLLRAVEGELVSRRYGDAVRLEVADNCPPELVNFLLNKFELGPQDLYQVNGPVNLGRLMEVYDLIDRADLQYPPFVPSLSKRLLRNVNIFDAIRHGDILLHHPFESFAPVIDLLRHSARDSEVLAIKMTLYRTGANSALVEHLESAAHAGKAVTVVIELRARQDEEANINLASRLQEAGAHVVYGVVGYKTHAKMMLVVRRESGSLRHYVHLGTGNYHARTARQYTDVGLLTCDPEIGEDVHNLFLELTSLGRVPHLHKLLQSPFTMHSGLIERIHREADYARRRRKARIIVKVNALVESKIIQALYVASQAGVKIDLIVRGMCCLRPGMAGVSENIRVRSIVGRFLEHSRVFYFHNGGKPEVFCASADWMDRNFVRRVEVAFPIHDKGLRRRVIEECLESYLQDNTHAWILQADGTYHRPVPGTEPPVSAQAVLLQNLADRVSGAMSGQW